MTPVPPVPTPVSTWAALKGWTLRARINPVGDVWEYNFWDPKVANYALPWSADSLKNNVFRRMADGLALGDSLSFDQVHIDDLSSMTLKARKEYDRDGDDGDKEPSYGLAPGAAVWLVNPVLPKETWVSMSVHSVNGENATCDWFDERGGFHRVEFRQSSLKIIDPKEAASNVILAKAHAQQARQNLADVGSKTAVRDALSNLTAAVEHLADAKTAKPNEIKERALDPDVKRIGESVAKELGTDDSKSTAYKGDGQDGYDDMTLAREWLSHMTLMTHKGVLELIESIVKSPKDPRWIIRDLFNWGNSKDPILVDLIDRTVAYITWAKTQPTIPGDRQYMEMARGILGLRKNFKLSTEGVDLYALAGVLQEYVREPTLEKWETIFPRNLDGADMLGRRLNKWAVASRRKPHNPIEALAWEIADFRRGDAENERLDIPEGFIHFGNAKFENAKYRQSRKRVGYYAFYEKSLVKSILNDREVNRKGDTKTIPWDIAALDLPEELRKRVDECIMSNASTLELSSSPKSVLGDLELEEDTLDILADGLQRARSSNPSDMTGCLEEIQRSLINLACEGSWTSAHLPGDLGERLDTFVNGKRAELGLPPLLTPDISVVKNMNIRDTPGTKNHVNLEFHHLDETQQNQMLEVFQKALVGFEGSILTSESYLGERGPKTKGITAVRINLQARDRVLAAVRSLVDSWGATNLAKQAPPVRDFKRNLARYMIDHGWTLDSSAHPSYRGPWSKEPYYQVWSTKTTTWVNGGAVDFKGLRAWMEEECGQYLTPGWEKDLNFICGLYHLHPKTANLRGLMPKAKVLEAHMEKTGTPENDPDPLLVSLAEERLTNLRRFYAVLGSLPKIEGRPDTTTTIEAHKVAELIQIQNVLRQNLICSRERCSSGVGDGKIGGGNLEARNMELDGISVPYELVTWILDKRGILPPQQHKCRDDTYEIQEEYFRACFANEGKDLKMAKPTKAQRVTQTAKTEASRAVYRVAGRQLAKSVRDPLLEFLTQTLGANRRKALKLLASPQGLAVTKILMGAGLGSLPQAKYLEETDGKNLWSGIPNKNPNYVPANRLAILAQAMREEGMADLGDGALDLLTGPLFKKAGGVMAMVTEMADEKVRVDVGQESDPEVQEPQEVPLEAQTQQQRAES